MYHRRSRSIRIFFISSSPLSATTYAEAAQKRSGETEHPKKRFLLDLPRKILFNVTGSKSLGCGSARKLSPEVEVRL